MELKCTQIELEYVKKLNDELRRTVSNLETIIQLSKKTEISTPPGSAKNCDVAVVKYNSPENLKPSENKLSSKKISPAIVDAQSRQKMNEIIHLEIDNKVKINKRPQKIVGSDSTAGDVSVGKKALCFQI